MAKKQQRRKTVQELEQPVVKLDVDYSAVDKEPKKERPYGRAYLGARSAMPEEQLFEFAEYRPQDAERTGYSNYSYWKSVWQNFIKNKPAIVMSIVFILLFIFTFVAESISPYSVATLEQDNKSIFLLPSSEHWFGTTQAGKDYWVITWYATRVSLALAAIVAVGQIIAGTVIGLVWGYVRKLDRFFTELYNLIDNVPTIIYMTLIALMVGQSLGIMAVTMIAFGWLGTARNVRNLVFMYRDREYNLASRCLGTKLWRVLFKNIFPYLISVIVLRLTLAIPGTIAYETTLSYLGLISEEYSLGILLKNARDSFLRFPHMLIFPAVIVSIITVTFYLVGNAFSDACDPRNHV